MTEKPVETMIRATTHNVELRNVARRIMDNQRISVDEGVLLFEQASLGFLGILADHCRQVRNGDNAFYIRNFHIEPTNICVNKCRFCSYSHHFSPVSWELTVDEILEKVRAQDESVSELHITGAVHPARDIVYYGSLLKKIRETRPGLHIKAYSAVELDYMIRKSGMSIREGLQYLKACGLESIPGGGAEIFNETIRQQICSMKTPAHTWLEIHETAHQLGIPSNATILYGHIENYRQRIEHLTELRAVQDRTGGFNAFIPLKFRNGNNLMDAVQEVSVTEDMKMYAVSRIFLDNFRHLKAYWPAVGRQLARISLSFGVDDLDGTINDSTRIYSLAGAEDQNPVMTVSEMIELIREAGRFPVERDSFYNRVNPGE